ncbi:helix-turn-helix transcriptional regulator [Deinococcus soli (ex Cha et al. 2016)]|uniref:Transcriptional regulator with XRE-family HTH domain n=2 Tax=Deinococcus soli (ex Cha et al. 2016) TaxID=1309411 RepID=A0ACC6KQH8_9DEIO|nr:helix-turn-helix transcriptional regulator [Deinococcus soli (ex Cha et al. 2016)]MDR6221517.1 transcriptional regulator with XRE-family HTH domain [Deinococcus soli (ex Cha et al. 2016)]MDR6331499.1 transcriptional regulator with XRE-family HTH domain [Deinococcus soli (ex Cha et al. 2016)]MDR6754666.1 transcriptional regulator with XRE-family HTH domain [Deinococcus soli (ex Cha et al. 2016)]
MTREERLAALLAQPERTVAVNESAPAKLLEEVTLPDLRVLADSVIATAAAGSALREARQQRNLTMRQAGEASGRSAPRIKAIEDTGTDILLGTVVEHAHALGYAARLVLTPLDGQGATIQAELGAAESGDWASETVLPARKKVGARRG